MAYSDKVVDHYENPRNVGSMDKSSEAVGTGLVGAPECGDVMRLADPRESRDEGDRRCQVQDLRLRLGDCFFSSLATEWVKGKTIDEATVYLRTPTS